MTVPPALATLVPLKAALSVTAVSTGTLRGAPAEPPPERVVLRPVDAAFDGADLLDLAAGALGGGVRRVPR